MRLKLALSVVGGVLALCVAPVPFANAGIVRIADDKLQVGFDSASGSLRELIQLTLLLRIAAQLRCGRFRLGAASRRGN